jgi:hypothetical protein
MYIRSFTMEEATWKSSPLHRISPLSAYLTTHCVKATWKSSPLHRISKNRKLSKARNARCFVRLAAGTWSGSKAFHVAFGAGSAFANLAMEEWTAKINDTDKVDLRLAGGINPELHGKIRSENLLNSVLQFRSFSVDRLDLGGVH